MNTPLKLGHLSVLICLFTFVVWIFAFAVIAVTQPLFTWTTLQEYILYTDIHQQFWKILAQSSMLIFAPAFLMITVALVFTGSEQHRVYSVLAAAFAGLFCVCSSVHYFIQLSIVPLSISSGQTGGLEQFIQANPFSGLAGMNLTGWTLFLGLSCLFMALHAKSNNMKTKFMYVALFTSVMCLSGGIAFAFDMKAIVFITLNPGMGGGILWMLILLPVTLRKYRLIAMENKIQ